MPIPHGAHQVPGEPNRVRLSDGRTVTRATALTMGARDMGYRSHRDYRGHAGGDRKYFQSWKNTEQGQAAIAQEKEIARSEGRRYSESDMQARLIAARNTRPHGGRSGGPAFTDFMDRYDLMDYGDDWVDY